MALAALVALLVLLSAAAAPAIASGGNDPSGGGDFSPDEPGDEDASGESPDDHNETSSDAEDARNDSAEDAAEDRERAREDAADDAEDRADDEADAREDRADDRADAADDREDDGEERREVRLDVDRDDGEAEFRSEGRRGDHRDEIRVRFSAPDAGLRLALENKTATREVEVDLRAHAPLLIEYADANGNGRYDLSDRVVQAVDVRGLPATLAAEPFPGGHRLTATYALPGNGTFQVIVAMVEAPATLGPAAVAPREAKVDFAIHNFPYRENATALALRVDVSTTVEADGARGANATEVAAVANGQRAYFRWADWAMVDGARRAVNATVHALEAAGEADEDGGEARTSHTVYLAYPRGDAIVHDPTLGVMRVQSVGDGLQEVARRAMAGDPVAYAAAAAAAAIVAGALAWARRGGPGA